MTWPVRRGRAATAEAVTATVTQPSVESDADFRIGSTVRVLTGLYYEAMVAVDTDRGDPQSSVLLSHHLGVMHAATEGLAAVLGRSVEQVSHRLEYGVPVGPAGDGWLVVHVAGRDGVERPVISRGDGSQVAVAVRLGIVTGPWRALAAGQESVRCPQCQREIETAGALRTHLTMSASAGACP